MISDALDKVIAMRRDNEDVFSTPNMLRTCYFVDEEVNEFYRVWEKITNDGGYLRGNSLKDADLNLKLQLEFGQAMMMLLTAAQLANINPDLALHLAIEVVYERSRKKREELDQNV